MTRFNRWCVVALGVLLVIAIPVAVQAWPTADSPLTGRQVLARVDASEDHAWSGMVTTHGALGLPVTDRFSGIGDLLGDETRLRAWWRGDEDWRVDRLLVSGEEDLAHQDGRTIAWSYEDNEARVSNDPEIRLPRTADLLPPVLGERVLRGVEAADVARIDTARVAGIEAPGIRIEPSAPQASIDHVDLWADPGSGVPLRVEVYAAGASEPSFSTGFTDFSAATPARSLTGFAAAPGAHVTADDVLDIADAANQFAPLLPPDRVGGLAKSSTSDGAVGVYGEGITQLIAIPLRDREADPLREQLRSSPSVQVDDTGTLLSAGPLAVLVSGHDGEGAWLVAGTVTADTLKQAAGDLLSGTTYVGDDR